MCVYDKWRLAHLDEELAGAEHKGGVRVTNARGELAEGPGIARVRVRAEEHLAGPGVALLREGHVAHTLIVRVGLKLGTVRDVVEVPAPKNKIPPLMSD
jgi:hypothetical protein